MSGADELETMGKHVLLIVLFNHTLDVVVAKTCFLVGKLSLSLCLL